MLLAMKILSFAIPGPSPDYHNKLNRPCPWASWQPIKEASVHPSHRQPCQQVLQRQCYLDRQA